MNFLLILATFIFALFSNFQGISASPANIPYEDSNENPNQLRDKTNLKNNVLNDTSDQKLNEKENFNFFMSQNEELKKKYSNTEIEKKRGFLTELSLKEEKIDDPKNDFEKYYNNTIDMINAFLNGEVLFNLILNDNKLVYISEDFTFTINITKGTNIDDAKFNQIINMINAFLKKLGDGENRDGQDLGDGENRYGQDLEFIRFLEIINKAINIKDPFDNLIELLNEKYHYLQWLLFKHPTGKYGLQRYFKTTDKTPEKLIFDTINQIIDINITPFIEGTSSFTFNIKLIFPKAFHQKQVLDVDEVLGVMLWSSPTLLKGVKHAREAQYKNIGTNLSEYKKIIYYTKQNDSDNNLKITYKEDIFPYEYRKKLFPSDLMSDFVVQPGVTNKYDGYFELVGLTLPVPRGIEAIGKHAVENHLLFDMEYFLDTGISPDVFSREGLINENLFFSNLSVLAKKFNLTPVNNIQDFFNKTNNKEFRLFYKENSDSPIIPISKNSDYPIVLNFVFNDDQDIEDVYNGKSNKNISIVSFEESKKQEKERDTLIKVVVIKKKVVNKN